MADEDSQRNKDIDKKVEDLWEGSNNDFWSAYIKEVVGGTEGEDYRVTDKGGGNVTVEKKVDGKWQVDESFGGKNGLSEKDAEAALKERRKSEFTDAEWKEIQLQARDLTGKLASSGISDSTQ
jgi:hypothetical protein